MLSKKLITVLAIIVFAILTVPRLFLDYGLDDDAYRSLIAADKIIQTGIYSPSRLPGNPLFEYMLSVLIKWDGCVLINTVILVSFLLSILAFYVLIREHADRYILTILFSFTPILLVNAATAMDYIPGLSTMLLSYVFLIRSQCVVAGILLALSVGFRLSNCLFFLPCILFLFLNKRSTTQILQFGLFSISGSMFIYLPIFLKYGFKALIIPKTYLTGSLYLLKTGYNAIALFGLIGTITLIIVISINLNKIRLCFFDFIKTKSPTFAVEIFTIILFILLFIIHSDTTSYLIPIIPFAYLFISRWASNVYLIFILTIVFSYSFISIEMKGGESGKRSLCFKPSHGIILQDYEFRKYFQHLRNNIANINPSNKAVIMIGDLEPNITYKNLNITPVEKSALGIKTASIIDADIIFKVIGKNVFLVNLLEKEGVEKLRQDGWDIFMFPINVRSTCLNIYNYDPYKLGVKNLF